MVKPLIILLLSCNLCKWFLINHFVVNYFLTPSFREYRYRFALIKWRKNLQIVLSNFLKKKLLIKEPSQLGATSSYNEYSLFKGSAAYAATEHGHQKMRSARENQKLIQGLTKKFNCSISSRNELKQTHNMAVIMTKKHISTNMSDLRRK